MEYADDRTLRIRAIKSSEICDKGGGLCHFQGSTGLPWGLPGPRGLTNCLQTGILLEIIYSCGWPRSSHYLVP